MDRFITRQPKRIIISTPVPTKSTPKPHSNADSAKGSIVNESPLENRRLILKASPKKSPPKKKGFILGSQHTRTRTNGCPDRKMENCFADTARNFPTKANTGREFFKGWSGNNEGLKAKFSQDMTRTSFTTTLSTQTRTNLFGPEAPKHKTFRC